jgi:mRNA interferase YafQ
MREIKYTTRFQRDYRVEKPAEVEENKRPPKSEHSAKSAANVGRFFMKFRGPQAHHNRREKSGRQSKKLDALLMEVVYLLAADTPLPRRNFDHPLSGEWSDHRDCHIRPDLVLIYRKPDDDSLELVRLGSHSELGL